MAVKRFGELSACYQTYVGEDEDGDFMQVDDVADCINKCIAAHKAWAYSGDTTSMAILNELEQIKQDLGITDTDGW